MKDDLQEFFSTIGKAKKEKEDEFNSLVGDLGIDSIFDEVNESVKKDNRKKKKLEKQAKKLEEWLYSKPEETIEIEDLNGNIAYEVIDIIKPLPLEGLAPKEVETPPDMGPDTTEYTERIEEDEEESTEQVTEQVDSLDHALEILDKISSKEELQENTSDPEIVKIRGELEYLKNLVNIQGGGGEVRLEFLDDIDRDSAKVNGKFLRYQSSTKKWVGDDGSGSTLDETLGLGNTSSLGMSVGVITATGGVFSGDVSIGGTLTYEDVKNIDSVGIITARKGIVVNSGYGINVVSGVVTATTFDGNLATTDLTGTITNAQLAGSITNAKLVNDSVSYGGVSLDLGGSDATPAFDLQDATGYRYSVLTGVTTDIVGDASPQLGGSLDLNSNNITGTGNIDITGALDVSGISTFTTINATSATFNGNVSIGGTLTYEDVKNIDSVGLITARTGVRVTSGGLIVSSGVSTLTTVSVSESVDFSAGGIISNVHTTSATGAAAIMSVSSTSYRSVNYQIQVTQGTNYNMTNINVIHDGSTTYNTEYGSINQPVGIATFSTDINSGSLRLLGYPASSSSTTFKVVATAMGL